MARWKEKASQGPRNLVIDRVAWLWSLEGLKMDIEPGPSYSYYPERWGSDDNVRLMTFEIQGMHHRLIDIAWKDARPPGSISSMDDMELHCGDPGEDRWAKIWRILGRAWVDRHGRIWQPGTCRSYLGQIAGRLRRAKAAAAKHENPVLEQQCSILGDALQLDIDALQAAQVQCNLGSAYPYPTPLPSPDPSREEEPEAPPAPKRSKPKTPQQEKVDAVLAVYDEAGINGEARPSGGVCAKWVSLYDGKAAVLVKDLGALHGRGHLDNGPSYVFGVLNSAKRKGNLGKLADPPPRKPPPRPGPKVRKWRDPDGASA